MFIKRKSKELTIPTHIAFIMDGNRRWAKKHGLNKMLGHKQGAIALKNIVLDLEKIEGVKYASFFAFSTENWKREQKEIDYIFELVENLIVENEEDYKNKNIKVVVMGDISRFPSDLQKSIVQVVKETENNTGLVVNLALNYGGRADIVHAVNELVKKGEKVTEESLQEHLYCPTDIDLLIRTSGEIRLSNFMLYQSAYSELYFTPVCWPDFNRKELMRAIEEFSKRNRRFGGK